MSLQNDFFRTIDTRQKSPKTGRKYWCHIEKFLDFHWNREGDYIDPRDMGREHIEAFVSHLARENYSRSSQNGAFYALRFLFIDVLGLPFTGINAERSSRSPNVRLPISRESVRRLLEAVTGCDRLVIELLYGSGLRLGEVAALRVHDIGDDRIAIHCGKGGKNRFALLPESCRPLIAEQMRHVERIWRRDTRAGVVNAHLPDRLDVKYPGSEKQLGWAFLFPARGLSKHPRTKRLGRWHMHESTIQNMVARVADDTGIGNVTPHRLRHSFASHLLADGESIVTISRLLGHSSLKTTYAYLHVEFEESRHVRSPLAEVLASGGRPMKPRIVRVG